ncbi:rhomboid family intramembrane serine protease [Streptomyces sp. AK02-01A]|uniref:rhomboid family intramembrane serine protease n=1 Tax=Streptomyces sp. AK02-01A TaxID=3028648 RepID=UPI0029B8B10A|nr:rhomboid family intramembrane serine protease [Streptomyces sp. AK02-01A]MDX3852803.1 rhomboid family intramembrane serine protease [Streptomyces sp. AK02-01A]
MEAAVTTCYRHPTYETYVRCARCDRYICPDCMREAAVGHQCVECVREGQRSVRQARTVFGGRVSGVSAPVVTIALIAVNVLVYLAELARPELVDRFGMLGRGMVGPDGAAYLYEPGFPELRTVGVADGEWYRLITGAFLHMPATEGGFWVTHVIFNMFALWSLGRLAEEQLGRARYLAVYLLSALGGSVLVYLIAPLDTVVGASGALFGLGAAFYVTHRRLHHDMREVNRFMAGFLIWMLISAGFASWEGHLGGLLAGGAVTLALAYGPAKHRTAVQVAAGTALLVLLIVLVVLKTSALTAGPA